MITLLVDADIIVMRAACAHEQVIDWGGNEFSSDGAATITSAVDREAALQMASRELDRLMYKTQSKDYLLCFSGANNWRKRLFPNYKSNRQGKWIPSLRKELMEYLMNNFKSRRVDGLEGDDLLGIEQIKRARQGLRTIIASTDKDLRQIQGWHYNWNKDPKPIHITREDGEYLHMLQTLSGDPCDGYKGCPRCGYAVAAKILPDNVCLDPDVELDTWSRIVSLYEAQGLTEGDAIDNARQARILRGDDYDEKNHRIKLWLPFGHFEWYNL